jgi:hypothetical protein
MLYFPSPSDCLPEIKSRIMSMMNTIQSQIDALGEPADDLTKIGGTLLSLLSKFAATVANCIDGKGKACGLWVLSCMVLSVG